MTTALTWRDAALRLADEPGLVILHGGLGGSVWLGVGATPRRAADATALAAALPDDPAAPTTPVPTGLRGWSDPSRGVVIQLDYEFPATPATIWQPSAWAGFHADGTCTRTGSPAARAALDARLASPPAEDLAPLRLLTPPRPAWSRSRHAAHIAEIHRLIAAGDCYQVNLAVPFHAAADAAPQRDLAIFLRLVALAAAPRAVLLRRGDDSIVGHSPEAALDWQHGHLVSVPIKGTRRRVPGREADTRAELLAAAKDRSELAMIVDLVRNDLGRHAEPGSVQVADPAHVIDLPHLHHLAGIVTARARQPRDPLAVLGAAFPPGSITGAPKQRAMQIIAQREGRPRGASYGVYGWMSAQAGETAVAIRTMTIRAATADAPRTAIAFPVGGGIVADSRADLEWDEVLAKAAALHAALGSTGTP